MKKAPGHIHRIRIYLLPLPVLAGSLLVGPSDQLGLRSLWAFISEPQVDNLVRTILLDIRLPRVLLVFLTGGAPHIWHTPTDRDRKEVGKMLEKAGIAHLCHRIYTELSGGERQLVMIARALAQEAGIFLLDEPVSHLDYNNQLRILRLLTQLVEEGITVAAVLHDPNLAFWFGDHFLFVHDQNVQADTSQAPWENPLLSEIFFEGRPTKTENGRIWIVPGQ